MPGKKVFDPLRHKYVALTPEEGVRQSFVRHLINDLGYPAALMANEVTLSLNGLTKRCDTLLYDTRACARMIVEYKAPNVQITQKVFDQIARYNISLRVEYLVVSNGRESYCCKVDYEQGTYTFLESVPSYADL